MNNHYDMVIVGAGPAGSTLARLMAGSGKRILLLDGQSVAHKKPCGGLLAPDAQKILAHFDLTLPKSVLVDPQIFSVKTMDTGSAKTRFYQRCYLNMDRYAFDRWLLSLVPQEVWVTAARCLDISRAGGVFSLTILRGKETETITAGMVVGADGASSVVRRKLFSPPGTRCTAIQQWFPAGSDTVPFYSCIFDPVTSPHCSWSIFKDGCFIFGGCFPPKDAMARFELQKTRLTAVFGMNFGTPIKTEACTALLPSRPKDFQTGGDGAFLIGEAAGFISPSSYEGISSAILSGSLLARALLDHPQNPHTAYRRLTAGLRRRMLLKNLKRRVMYSPFLRRLILASGIKSIAPYRQ